MSLIELRVRSILSPGGKGWSGRSRTSHPTLPLLEQVLHSAERVRQILENSRHVHSKRCYGYNRRDRDEEKEKTVLGQSLPLFTAAEELYECFH